jgi:hypothetical protein
MSLTWGKRADRFMGSWDSAGWQQRQTLMDMTPTSAQLVKAAELFRQRQRTATQQNSGLTPPPWS